VKRDKARQRGSGLAGQVCERVVVVCRGGKGGRGLQVCLCQ
jgi:hypothetical protein